MCPLPCLRKPQVLTSILEEVITDLFTSSLINSQFSFPTLNSEGKQVEGLDCSVTLPARCVLKIYISLEEIQRTTPKKLKARPEMLELQTFFP